MSSDHFVLDRMWLEICLGTRDKFIACYDRGWDVKPLSMKLVNQVLDIVTA